MVKVSVIIPCYNHGEYIKEAIDSVLSQTFNDFEIIVVNDGSTDKNTKAILDSLRGEKIKIIHTKHQGLAQARNSGIENSSGKYILPLDSDDRISSEYLANAVKFLDTDDTVKIVYCDAEWFGERSGLIKLPEFSMKNILLKNIILSSAFFRRRDYDLTRGYDKNLVCYEDWDFWLSLLDKGGKVYKIPKTLFYYRFRSNSMRHDAGGNVLSYSTRRIYLNHTELYLRYFENPIKIFFLYDRFRTPLVLKIHRIFKNIKSNIKDIFVAIMPSFERTFICEQSPRVYHFLMTNYCNANCIFCNQRFNDKSRKEISLDEFKIIISNIPILSVEQFHFTGGGEPLLCPDLFKIIKYVNDTFPWIEIIVTTNGLLIGKYADELAQLNISRLKISIHGDEEINDMILQRKGSQAIFEGIANLNKCLQKYDKEIYTIFVPNVSYLNINEIPKLIIKAAELNVNGVQVYFCRYFSYKKSRGGMLLDQKDSLYFHKWRYNKTIYKSKRLARHFRVDFSYDPLFFRFFPLKRICYQPWQMMVIDWNGNVYPCCGGEERFKTKVQSGEYNFGNLLEKSVNQCWNNPTYVNIRKTCIPGAHIKVIPECERCHFSIWFEGPNKKYAHIIEESK